MKRLFFIFFILLHYGLIMGQPVNFSQATEVGRSSASTPTSGLYSYNPRIEGEYYCIDFYARRYVEWAGESALDYANNFVGAFDLAFSMSVVEIGGPDFKAKFIAYEFILAENNFKANKNKLLVKPADRTPDVTDSGINFCVSYVNDPSVLPMGNPSEIGVPYFLGTLKLKIKPGLTAGIKSEMFFSISAASAGSWSSMQEHVTASQECMVFGFLDGKDINIDLVPKAETTKPADPIFATGESAVCPNTSATYTIGAAKNATGYEWFVASDKAGTTKITDSNMCVITPAANGLSATVQWKNLSTGNYWVCVKAKNSATPIEYSEIVSYAVNIRPRPTVTLAVAKGEVAYADKKTIEECAGTLLNFSVTGTATSYVWSGTGVSGNGSAKNVTLANATMSPISEKYKVIGTLDGCSAADSALISVKPIPTGLYFNPPVNSSYAKGAQLQTSIMAASGVTLSSYQWTSPVSATTSSITTTVDGMVGSTKTVAVEVTNNYGCKAQKSTPFTVERGLDLALTPFYGESVICTNGVVLLKAMATELTSATYTYKWYSGTTATGTPLQTTSNVSEAIDYYEAKAAGDYFVEVASNGLIATASIKITTKSVNATSVTVLPEIVAATPDKKVVLMATTSAGAPTWKWIPESKLNDAAQSTLQYPLTAAVTNGFVDYKVYMKDASGCVSTGTTKVKAVTNNLALKVEPSTASLCLGNKVQLKATLSGGSGSGPTYSWAPTTGLNQSNISNPIFTATLFEDAGNYIVKAQRGNEVVTAQVNIQISNQQAPVLQKVSDIFCVGQNLSVTDQNGNTNLSYNWKLIESGKETDLTVHTPSINISTAGQYTIKVVGVVTNTCTSDTLTIPIEVRQIQLSQSVNPSPEYLEGATIVSTATARGGWEPYTYSWTSPIPQKLNTSENTYTILGASQSTYGFAVSVKDNKGCEISATPVEVRKKTGGLLLTVDTMYAYCDGGMAMMKAVATGGTPGSGYTYEWRLQGSDAVLSTTDTHLEVDPATNTTFNVTVKDQSTPPLMRNETFLLTDKKLTEKAPVLTTPGTITIFTGGKAIVSASSDKTISQWNWQPEDKMTEPHKQYAQTIALTAEQQYTVYAIDTKGCISQKATEKVSIVSEGNIGGFDLSIIANAQMCAGAKQTLSVDIIPSQSSPTYSWVSTPNLFAAAEKTKATPEINPMAAGSYEISVTVTAGGISNTAVKTIEVTSNPVPVLAMNFKTKVCEGDVVTVTSSSFILNGVYTWYVDGVQQAGSTNQLPLTINGTHTIKVSGTTEQGCVGEQEETRTINEQPVLSWNPALTNPVEMYSSLVATAVPAKKTVADYTYDWAVTPTGTPAANVYTVITKLGDTKIDLSVVATDKTTTCQSKPLTGSVTVAGGLGADLLAEGLVCSGGSAKLVVSNITGDVGPYTYEWIKTGVPGTVLRRDSILMVPAVMGDSYTVTIKKQGTEKKVIKDIVLAPEAGKTAPLVTACADITIPVNSQAVLTANAAGTAPFIYTWLPVSKLKSPVESHFQSPTTASLTGDTPYEVYVSDKVGCISAKDELTVKVNLSTALRVSIEPDMELCLGNTVHYRAIVTDQNGQTVNIVQSEWKALQGISRKTLLTGDYKPTKAGVDTIVVVVSNGTLTATAKRVVKIKSYNVPTLDFANSVKCDKETLQLTSQSVFNNYNWIIQQGTTIVKHTGNNHQFTAPGTYTVKVYGTTAQCVSDTLEKEVMINPIPSIQEIQIDSVCGKAKLVAITTDADRWTWTDLTASGVTMTTKDSLCYYKTLAMSAAYNGTLQVASNAGCESPTATAFKGTVYSLPAISMLPLKTSVYPNTAVDIEATLTPAIAYTLEWEKANLVASGQGTNKIKTKPLSTAVDPYLFIIKVTNTANTACKISDTSTISVDNKDFAVSFGKDTLDICQDVKGHFAVTAVNNKYDPITYAYTSDYPGFDAAMAAVKKESFDYTFAAGIYRIRVKATNANTPSPDVRKDSIIVRVNPTPTLDITSPGVGGSYSLCDNKGKLEVAMKATGTGGWTLHYRLASAKKQESFTTAAHTMILSEGGEFYTDSIVDSKRCKKDYSASMIGFTVKDDIPRLALKSTTGITKCQGTTTDLNIEITNASALDYALTLYYKHGPTQVQYSFTDASTKFADNYVGIYTIDSIVSARQCAYKLTANRQVTVSEYTETVPLLTLTDKGNKSFCEGNSVNIPLQISNGGKPDYTITYALAGGSDKTIVLPTSGNINVTENGPLVIKGFADGNGCGNYTANETIQITKNANPVVEITTTERLLCGGTLDLGITLSQGEAPYNLHYTLNGVAKPVNTYSTAGAAVWTIAEKGRFDIVKVEDANGCSVAGTAVTGGPTIDVDSFRLHVKFNGSDAQCATADAKLKFDFTGTDWAQVVGPLKVEYDYTPLGGSVQHLQITKTKTEAQGGSVLLSGIQQGTYTLVKITDLKTDGVGTACEGILPAVAAEKSVTVIKAPVVEIDSVDFALYQGDKFKLGIKDLNISDFIYSWQKLPDAPTTATAPDYKVTGTMGTQDMKYVLKGSNKNVASCFNTDTVRIYKIPDPLVIAIDTNLTRNDLKITWNTTNPNDVVTGYRLMHNLWDGYAIETQYTPKIASTFGTIYEIAKNDLDTLEFFYATAYRSILMNGTTKTFYSKESDTVGYYKYDIIMNTAASKKLSNNLVVLYFDPIPMGIPTAADIILKYGEKNVPYVREFLYNKQAWNTCRIFLGKPSNSFVLKNGMVLQLEPRTEFIFLQYGILPKPIDLNIHKTNEAGKNNNNMSWVQPNKIKDKTSAVLLGITNVAYVRKWNFSNQGWDVSRIFLGKPTGVFNLKLLMPLQIELNASFNGSLVW